MLEQLARFSSWKIACEKCGLEGKAGITSMQVVDFATILWSIFGSASLTLALVFVLRTWISERLRQSIAHEYALKLEAHRAVLKAEYDVALERIRVDNAQQTAIQAAAIGSFAEGHKAAHERRLQAVSTAWKAILALAYNTPPALFIEDHMTREEYPQFFSDPSYTLQLDSLSEGTLFNFIKNTSFEVEDIRPFIGETIYSLFAAYQSLISVAIYKLLDGKKKRRIEPWFEDRQVRELLERILTHEELQQFNNLRIAKFKWLAKTMHNKIVEHMAHVVSGEASATTGLDHARRIVEAVRALEINSTLVLFSTSPIPPAS